MRNWRRRLNGPRTSNCDRNSRQSDDRKDAHQKRFLLCRNGLQMYLHDALFVHIDSRAPSPQQTITIHLATPNPSNKRKKKNRPQYPLRSNSLQRLPCISGDLPAMAFCLTLFCWGTHMSFSGRIRRDRNGRRCDDWFLQWEHFLHSPQPFCPALTEDQFSANLEVLCSLHEAEPNHPTITGAQDLSTVLVRWFDFAFCFPIDCVNRDDLARLGSRVDM